MDVLNRTTKQYLRSVNEPDYPQGEWIWGPDLTGVQGVPQKYWRITGDTVAEMNPAQKTAVDAAEEEAHRQAAEDSLDQLADIQVAFNHVVFDEINLLRSALSLAPRTLAQLKTALRNKVGI